MIHDRSLGNSRIRGGMPSGAADTDKMRVRA
jgi:hypothetical protein